MHTILDRVEQAYAKKDYAAMAAAFFPFPCGFMTTADWKTCIQYINEVPDETKKASVYFCLLMALNSLQTGDTLQLRRWQAALIALRDAAKENSEQRRQSEYAIYWLNAQIPQADNGQLLLTLAILYNGSMDKPVHYGHLSATGGRPTVLRGVKDLSEWGKNYRAVRSILQPMLPELLDDSGQGACEAAIAELAYERNQMNEASIQIAAALSAQNPEIRFVGMAMLARINRLDPAAKSSREILGELGYEMSQSAVEGIQLNYKAICAREAMEKGRLDEVDAWLKQEPTLPSGYSTANIFRLITKAKAMIALGHYRDALTLLEQIILSMEQDFRPLDTAECLANSAVACNLLGSTELAQEKLQKALSITRQYGYIRVYADLGAPMQQLLNQLDAADDGYVQSIQAAAALFAQQYPGLYAPKAVKQKPASQEKREKIQAHCPEQQPEDLPKLVEKLTHSEENILQLLAAGKSNKEIAEEIDTKLTTVKFHVKNIFGKLGAKNRTEAVNLAKRYGLV